MEPVVAVLLVVVLVGVPALVLWRVLHGRRDLGSSPAERATFETLHTASLAAPPLRAGLTEAGAQKASRHLRALLGSPALAITDEQGLLVYDGEGDHHAHEAFANAARTLADGRTQVLGPEAVSCDLPECPIRYAVVVPLTTDGRVVGSLAAYGGNASAGLVRAAHEVARWVDSQLELAELDRSRTRLMEAEMRALRAQISPHFIYNSLTTIASFVRSDPDRSRELLLDFADFTRYSFRQHGEFTTLAEELRSIDRYLTLERARFGDQLQVTLRIAPEVLAVAVPFLCLQPLVENAVRHGLESKPGVGRISIVAEDAGSECRIGVEDDGVGMDPDRLRRILAGDADERSGTGGVGLANVDERLRQVYGDEYGLVVETGKGAGTKVSVRLPKYRPGVSAR
ncbi:signal transduction histidine kinase [Planobispora rosea]|uniref:histidine kinase n=1 Tax=Planobispora rosea TaxID=35762 RepID=A0A8J3RZP3_PLARO|nr:histidine kinase [Planobispora rosea]GGS70249.1 signal transduction histidine kinase [Planobispora rosea]GIH83241.1 signal transduction histidine kinase [Planobispora rosea]